MGFGMSAMGRGGNVDGAPHRRRQGSGPANVSPTAPPTLVDGVGGSSGGRRQVRLRVRPPWNRSGACSGTPNGGNSRRGVGCRTIHPHAGNGLWRSLVSAPDWGSGGRRFESGQSDEVG